MLPDTRSYLLAIAPAGLHTVQLVVHFFSLDMSMKMAVDLMWVAFTILFLRLGVRLDALLALTVICVGQAMLTSNVYGADPLRFLHQVFFLIIYPLLIAHAYARYERSEMVLMAIIAALGLATLNLVVFPLELMLRGGLNNLHKLQFSGRSYELIAILMVAMSIAATDARRSDGGLYANLVISALISFSRGAIAITLMILFVTARRQLSLLASSRGLILFAILSLTIIWIFTGTLGEPFRQFWTVRMNFAGDQGLSENFENFIFGFGRIEVWYIGLSHISERPFMGSGVATVSEYIREKTSGLYAYSGYHNLTLTVLAERGIFVGSLFLVLLMVIINRLVAGRYIRSLIFFLAFLLFAHTTGAELVIFSSGVRNANVLFFTFLLFLVLTKSKGSRNV